MAHHLSCALVLPDGSCVDVGERTVLGRGSHPSLTDNSLSREHIVLTQVPDVPEAVRIEVVGLNREPLVTDPAARRRPWPVRLI